MSHCEEVAEMREARPDCMYALQEIEAWKRHKEHERQCKFEEQKKIREMMESYWPWRNRSENPRGFKNVHFDNTNPVKATRIDCGFPKKGMLLNMGKPGGGAPMMTPSGKKLVKTREDPMLRFQWGDDLRRTVDNSLRYRVSKEEQLKYKKELDKMVKEKQIMRQTELRDDLEHDHRMGYTSNDTIKNSDFESEYRKNMENDYAKFKTYLKSNNEFKPYDPVRYTALEKDPVLDPTRSFNNNNIRLSPLQHQYGKERGDELVPIICEKRSPIKAPLSTTDVTRGAPSPRPNWKLKHGPSYLQELTKQMQYKSDLSKAIRVREHENSQQHFSTWDSFWGRPGHGAPKSAVKKGCLDRLLYPQMMPIGVH